MRACFRAIGSVMLALVALLVLAGCGGVTQRDVTATTAAGASETQRAPGARGVVRIERVENKTGRAECDDLAHFVHLKAAQLLEAEGWSVLSDDLLAGADFLALAPTASAPDGVRTLRIELAQAEEKAGATVSLGLFSTQGQTATVRMRVRIQSSSTTTVEREASGSSAKGAWGVLAQVNREALTRREGFWQFDRSLLGGAATEALAKALTHFP